MALRNKTLTGLATLGAMTCLATSASALEKDFERRGPFFGMGTAGRAVLPTGSADTGGEGVLDLQFGGGASSSLTLSLDIDASLLTLGDETAFSIIPGPELTVFLGGDGLFVRAGFGVGLNSVWLDDQSEFSIGMNGDVGFGWEFFVNRDVAIGVALETGYTFRDGANYIPVGFTVGFKRY